MKDSTVTAIILIVLITCLVIWAAGADFTDFLSALDSSVEQHNLQSFAERKVSGNESLSFIGDGDIKAAINR